MDVDSVEDGKDITLLLQILILGVAERGKDNLFITEPSERTFLTQTRKLVAVVLQKIINPEV